MKLREFLNMYDNWNDIVCVNDDDGCMIIQDKLAVALSHGDVYTREVVSFGFCDNELYVRVK